MRLWYLYLRSRLAGWALISLAGTGVISCFWLAEAGNSDVPIELSLIVLPLMAATVIGTSTRSPFGDIELSTSLPLPPLRLGHIGLLFLTGAVGLAAAGWGWSSQSIEWELVRNLAGFTGLAFLGSRILGSGICWVVPLGYGVVALLVESHSRWAWPIRLPADQRSVVVASTLILVGLFLVTYYHRHENQNDS